MKEIRQILDNAIDLPNEIRQLEEEIKTLESGQLPSGIRYDKDRVQSSPVNQMEEFGWNVLELSQQINFAKDKLVKDVMFLNEIIDRMPTSIHRQLIKLRYIKGYDWWKVGNEIGYSEFHTRTDIHSNALKEINEVYKQARSGTNI